MNESEMIPGYVWCGHWSGPTESMVIILTARAGKRMRLRRLTGSMAGKDIMVTREQLHNAFRPLSMHCARTLIGSGGDTYDPVCELPGGHDGPCRSSSAIDQHRIGARR
jgi:hypothetical protein